MRVQRQKPRLELVTFDGAEMRVADDGKTICGYAAVFGVPTDRVRGGRESLRRGCFTKTLQEKTLTVGVPLLWNHDTDKVLGNTAAGTLTIREDDRGLRFECEAPDTTWGRDAVESVRRGDAPGCSFMFTPVLDEWKGTGAQRCHEIVECELHEVSCGVCFPAYGEATATVRACDPDDEKTVDAATGGVEKKRGQIMNKMARAKMLSKRLHEIGFGQRSEADEQEFNDLKAELRSLEAEDAEVRGWLAAQVETPEDGQAKPETRASVVEGLVRTATTPEGHNGRVRVLRHNEKLVDHVRGALPDGIRADDLSLTRLVRGLAMGDWSGADAERRVMTEGSATAGGHLVPTPLSAQVLDKVRAASAAVQLGAQTVPMDAPTLKIAKVTGDPTGYWRAENAAITASDLTIGAVTLTAKTLAARVKLSGELFEDGQGVSDVVANALSQALAGELDRVCFHGSGVDAEPTGILVASGTGSVSMGTNGLALTNFDPFLDAIQKILEGNYPETGLGCVYSPRTMIQLAKLKDTTDQPLAAPGAFLNLNRVVSSRISNTMTQGTASTASAAIVGAFSNLLIGMRTSLLLEFSREASDSVSSAFESYQVWCRAILRADVQLARADAFAKIIGIIPPAA
jgi:HK97 family phage major capsid protein/HK97 family phage prohead protease